MPNLPARLNEVTAALTKRTEDVQRFLGDELTAEAFIAMSEMAIRASPKVLACSPISITQSLVECAELRLIPGGILGEAYLVPFKGKCTLIVGYRGLQKLAVRSGKVSHILADVVYSADNLDFEQGTSPRLNHTPSLSARGDRIAAYAVAYLTTGGPPAFCVMAADEIDAIRQRSPGGRSASSPWATDTNEMWKKTAIRRLCKNLPYSRELVRHAVKGEYLAAGIGNGASNDVDLDKPGRQALPAKFVQTEELCPECQGEGVVNVPGGGMTECPTCGKKDGMPSNAEIEAAGY